MTLVVDASVALKWQFEDEEDRPGAMALLEDFVEGSVDLITTALFPYEILSGIYVAIKRRRISEEAGEKSVRYLLSLGIEQKTIDGLAEATFRMALQYDLSPYDCSYMSLAYSEETDFLTGDKKLFSVVRRRLRWVKWVGDYQSGGASSS
jgi:predicted nucleic acid-binding protein